MTLATAVFLGSCHRVSDGPESLKIDGFRYRTGSAVVGPAHDTLRVAVVVVNDSRTEHSLAIPSCPPTLNPVKARLRAGGREWDSETSEVRKLPPRYRDSTGRVLPQACTLQLIAMSFPPGTSHTYVLEVPVREILGDSLPKGRYEVTAQLRINGYLTPRLSTGDVDLVATDLTNRHALMDQSVTVSRGVGACHPKKTVVRSA
ncbi:MAG: hypothetical protein QOH22_761 [Gemmatimonadaceae bacterium]|nr:hypothetical protein [Gemmatimonadaceae bacterium]